MFIALLIIIGLAVYLFWNSAGSGRMNWPGHDKDDALDLLKKRYINGEIDEITYEKMKRTLNE